MVVRGCYDTPDSFCVCNLKHLLRLGKVFRPVIDSRQNVAMHIYVTFFHLVVTPLFSAFYRFLISWNKFIISFSSLRNFLRTKNTPPGILIISYQWKEGYLSSSSYIYTFYKCYVISLYLAFCL